MNDETLKAILDRIDSSSPTPGGGSVAAITAQLGICLGRMYGHLSLHKKSFIAQNEETITDFKETFVKLENWRKQMEKQAEEDIQVYGQVMSAYRQKDQKAIQKALQEAIRSPLDTMEYSAMAMEELTEKMLPYGNKNAVSDCAIAVLLLNACMESSYLNVLINVQSLEDEETKKQALQEAEQLKNKGAEYKEKAMIMCISMIEA